MPIEEVPLLSPCPAPAPSAMLSKNFGGKFIYLNRIFGGKFKFKMQNANANAQMLMQIGSALNPSFQQTCFYYFDNVRFEPMTI